MKVCGNLSFQEGAKLERAALATRTGFPSDARVGEFAFIEATGLVALCVQLANGLPLWVPLTRELTLYQHSQPTPALEWVIDHNLGSSLVLCQVYDTDGKMVQPDEIDCSRLNQVRVSFSIPFAGSAICQYSDPLLGNRQTPASYEAAVAESAVWTVNHNLGYFPAVTCIVDGALVQPQSIVHDSTMQTTITFSAAVAGTVRCV